MPRLSPWLEVETPANTGLGIKGEAENPEQSRQTTQTVYPFLIC